MELLLGDPKPIEPQARKPTDISLFESLGIDQGWLKPAILGGV